MLGDSHVGVYSQCKNTRVCLIDDDLSILDLKTHTKDILRAIDSHKHEPWLLIIGERDCRKNIFIESVQAKEALDDTIDRYATKLVRFLSVLNATYTVYATSVAPTGYDKDETSEYYVPREIRQIITAKYNARLQVIANKTDIPYLRIWKMGATPKDMCPADMFEDDNYHIKAKKASEALDEALKIL